MCGCAGRILQPVTEDVKVFEVALQPYNGGALIANKSIFGAIEIPCFFRAPGTTTEILGYELIERCGATGTLVKLAAKFLMLGYNGYSVSPGAMYVMTNLTEASNPILALDSMASLDYVEQGAQVAHGFKQAKPGTFVKNSKVFGVDEGEINASAWLHVLSGGSGTYASGDDAYSARIRVKYRRFDNC